MPVEIDGFAVLGAIARAPQAFGSVKGEVIKTAKALIGKQLKDKSVTCDSLVFIAQAVDHEAFDLIIDTMTDAELKSLLAKVDKNNIDVKAAAPADQRRHLIALAWQKIAPASKAVTPKAPKQPSASRSPAVEKPVVKRAGNSRAMRAKKEV
ncbi:hypothetical protein LGH83_11625 [Lichenihabitans sp. PAMC28606]|uniref:hypothetical protein n=1 Tax=Lichenihabitans sp. PAMC28606 TaxID=2880932 RepID=UPI001D0A5C57|nr:hypothetical protein [Lichenihabitans sp. PAMC28606]UDL93252.1 hypothetical protein LGH83_11625 [Lichenihabitans sp. PAMC28606]